ncbi:MAG: hypothetical protein M1358_14290 [Chloroflexi bacterium]|nr:hypothetical protein [Chloroflexota bacterium]
MRKSLVLAVFIFVLVTLLPLAPGKASAAGPEFSDEGFRNVWNRTDLPVIKGMVSRSWYWGPTFPPQVTQYDRQYEPYLESPNQERLVLYFDKSRMEINNPYAPPGEWYVTNGLLVKEMISGQMQMGDNTFTSFAPSQQSVAGDPDDPVAPTYATLTNVLGRSPARVGQQVTSRLLGDGRIRDDLSPAETADPEAQIWNWNDVYGHNVPKAFVDFMSQVGLVYRPDLETWANEQLVNSTYALGYPITEPYWMSAVVGGETKLVMMQAFERRTLTYTPDNPPGWKVEMGNVGQHYYKWRYVEVYGNEG